MTISFRGISGTQRSGTTAVTMEFPVVEPTDLTLWGVIVKYPPVTPNTPAGMLPVGYVTGGGGAPGADAGEVGVAVFKKECDGSEDGYTEAKAAAGGNSITSRALAYQRTVGQGWDVAFAPAVQATAADIWSVVSTSDLDLRVGDMLVAIVGINSDTHGEHNNSHTLAANTITFGAITIRIGSFASISTTNGDDCALHVFEAPVTAGNATGPIAMTINWGGTGVNHAGGVAFLRLRETDVAAADSGAGRSLALLGVG